MINDLMNHPVIQTILFIFALVGFPGSVVALIQMRKKRISYYVKSARIINNSDNSIEGLKIIYNGEEVENFNITYFVLWNSGNKEIRASDISEKLPLLITVGKGKLIESKTEEVSDPGITINLKEDIESLIGVNFDYIEPRHGIVFKILHTGASTKSISLEGKIIGGRICSMQSLQVGKKNINSIIKNIVFFTIIWIILLSFFLAAIATVITEKSIAGIIVVVFIGIMTFGASIGYYSHLKDLYRYFRPETKLSLKSLNNHE